jgi:hypothetical protein
LRELGRKPSSKPLLIPWKGWATKEKQIGKKRMAMALEVRHTLEAPALTWMRVMQKKRQQE